MESHNKEPHRSDGLNENNNLPQDFDRQSPAPEIQPDWGELAEVVEEDAQVLDQEEDDNMFPLQFLRALFENNAREAEEDGRQMANEALIFDFLLRRSVREATHEDLIKRIFDKDTGMLTEEEVNSCENIRQVMSLLPRAVFVPKRFHVRSNHDMPLDLTVELNTNLSAPHIYPKLLHLLDLKPGLRVLDIGSGTGYLSVCCACLVKPNGTVEGWELDEDVVKFATQIKNEVQTCLSDATIYDRITYLVRDAFWPHLNVSLGLYDRIHIGSAICHNQKAHFLSLLKVGGKLVAPIEDGLFVIERVSLDEFVEKNVAHVGYRFLIHSPLPVWEPELHSSFPAHLRLQIEEVWKIHRLTTHPISFLPLEILFKVFQFISCDDPENANDEESESEDSSSEEEL